MWKSKLNLETKKKRSRKPIRIAAALLATAIAMGAWIFKSDGLQVSYAAGGGTLSASGASIQLINTQSLQGMT